MKRLVPLTLAAVLAAPATAGTLLFWENTQGAPGVTAQFSHGVSLNADVDFDADSAEGGGLLWGATEIEIRPTGSVAFVDFSCELQGCFQNVDYVFVPGTSGDGARVVVSDPDFQSKNGIWDLGTLQIDAPQDAGSVGLVDCNYTGQDFEEHSCDPFVLVSLPEPGFSGLLAAGAALLFGALRGRARAARSLD